MFDFDKTKQRIAKILKESIDPNMPTEAHAEVLDAIMDHVADFGDDCFRRGVDQAQANLRRALGL